MGFHCYKKAMKHNLFNSVTLIVTILNVERLSCTESGDRIYSAYEHQVLDTQETYTGEQFQPADKEMNLSQKAEFYNRNVINELKQPTRVHNPGDNVLKYIVSYNQQLKKITKIYVMDRTMAVNAMKDILRFGKPTFLNVSVSEKGLVNKFLWSIHDLAVLSDLKNQTINLWNTCLSYVKQ